MNASEQLALVSAALDSEEIFLVRSPRGAVAVAVEDGESLVLPSGKVERDPNFDFWTEDEDATAEDLSEKALVVSAEYVRGLRREDARAAAEIEAAAAKKAADEEAARLSSLWRSTTSFVENVVEEGSETAIARLVHTPFSFEEIQAEYDRRPSYYLERARRNLERAAAFDALFGSLFSAANPNDPNPYSTSLPSDLFPKV